MIDLVSWGRVALLGVHAVAATAALVAGILALHTGRGVGVHKLGVFVMALALGPSLTLGWIGFAVAERVTFSLLAALSAVMVVQVFRAERLQGRESRDLRRCSVDRPMLPVGPAFVRTLGFNGSSLTVAGTIVPVLRVGGGAVGVIAAVVMSVAVTHLLVERQARRADSNRRAMDQPDLCGERAHLSAAASRR